MLPRARDVRGKPHQDKMETLEKDVKREGERERDAKEREAFRQRDVGSFWFVSVRMHSVGFGSVQVDL